ncbi:MAG: hypothetical protein CVT99_02125 [Bacteroidetes bacterium HGW-Bacteroidetes-16]|jgi:hypothetical protein|nr:MAG: hypothetical protein CVT99_02125 [Bacteroidetes bacterium HGW-Bacteroidetes-16]
MNDLNNIIKKELENRERNFTWLADKIEYTRQGLKSALENGTIRVDTMIKIADALEISPLALFNQLSGINQLIEETENTSTNKKLEEENEFLKKRILELEDQLEDKKMALNILRREGAISLYNLITPKEKRQGDYSTDFNNTDSLLEDLNTIPHQDQNFIFNTLWKMVNDLKKKKD